MSAKHAVLGLVIERPGYGYDLARRLRERFGSSGFAPTGVYSALDQLRVEGLVRSAGSLAGNRSERAPERAAPRTIYEATDEGREQFDRWMLCTSSLANVRDELNMKLALSRPSDLPALIESARAQEQQCLARIQALKRLDRPSESVRARSDGLAWTEISGLLVRDAEVRQLQARVEWLQRVSAIMAKLDGKQRPRSSREIPAVRGGEDARALQQAQAGTDGGAMGARLA
ncbi:MAG: PadR family transcriptional regulator [Solirubrobacteraceae bacterium]